MQELEAKDVRSQLTHSTRELCDTKFIGLNVKQIDTALVEILTKVQSLLPLEDGIYSQYKLFAAVLPTNVPQEVDDRLRKALLTDDESKAKVALVLLHMRTIISVIEKKKISEQLIKDEILQEVMIALVAADLHETTSYLSQDLYPKAESIVDRLLSQRRQEDEVLYTRRTTTSLLTQDPLEMLLQKERIEEISTLLEGLTPRQKQVCLLRMLAGETREEAGARIGISRVRVGQIANTITSKVRRLLHEIREAERVDLILSLPPDLLNGVRDAFARGIGTKAFVEELQELKKQFPLFQERIGVLQGTRISLDRQIKQYQFTHLLKGMATPVQFLMDQIIARRDPHYYDMLHSVMDYEAELLEALSVLGISDIDSPGIEQITLREVYEAYLSGRIKSTSQRPDLLEKLRS